jgi:tetratricopeptide (TPR) repeat protein
LLPVSVQSIAVSIMQMTVHKVIFFLFIPASLVGFFTLLIMTGPKSIDYESLDARLVSPEESKVLKEKSMELEGAFDELYALDQVSEDDYELLFQAIVFQEEYLESLPYFSQTAEERLVRLRERFDQTKSEPYYQITIVSERESKQFYELGDFESARIHLSKAIESQLTINEQYPLSSYKNFNRLTQLNRELKYLEAYPIYKELTKLIAKSDDLVEAGELATAAEIIQEAIDLQSILNSEYRSSKVADSRKLVELKNRYIDLKSEPDYRAIMKLIQEADQLVSEGNYLKATDGFDQALAMQRKLNKNYPLSRYASEDMIHNLIRKSQTAESFFLSEAISAINIEINDSLKARNPLVAKEKIIRATDMVLRMKEEFPKSSYYDDQIELKIKYLNLIRNDLELIHSRIYAKLLPIPEEAFMMLDTEVTQALYTTIMGVNPSRSRGDLMPVESVSWVEANEFCKRLSWILGYVVRLPKEYEFRKAIGRLRYIKVEEYAVSSRDLEGLLEVAQKEPLSSSYFDLLGNVSEWLYSDTVFLNDAVNHIGGHFSDSNQTIYSVPLRKGKKDERSRLIGFRFVVEI